MRSEGRRAHGAHPHANLRVLHAVELLLERLHVDAALLQVGPQPLELALHGRV
jgi:hypothetical protein